ncbi:Gfo/Idh/MocA family protein [Pseudorhodobacter sp.]|uniref:Gfo/Idh/MocA family protein n=1 Tax=Pseudorhodobacter sp. TaxID=1934400 RepID=UPI0026496065|nr:Gfo/Idh/MocA family oxidoreductase [Pseudorhodobacter sp.]MDN5787316.1 Gfo/Idh/MocA family oxidoreductase [Pseudorhodobacter sp.]
MTKPIRWGVLGASKFAREHMAPAIHAAKGAELAAIASSDPAKAALFLAFAPAARLHDSYDALLADPMIDAVYIPLPNHVHLEWTLKALASGKHVLCEKPICLKAPQIAQIIAARDASGLLAAEAFMIVHHPQWQRARDLVQSGAIGNVTHVDGVFTYDNRADPGNIRNKPETGGGGIYDIGVYTYGSARFVTGAEPQALHTRMQQENGVDTWAQVTGIMAGPMGRFTYSATTSLPCTTRKELICIAAKAFYGVPPPFNANVFAEAQLELRQGMRVTTERWPGVNQYVLQVQNFGDSIRSGAPYPCPLEFTQGTAAMIDKIFAGAEVIALT